MDKFNDDFFEWLNQCPVQWFRVSVEDGVLEYQFIAPVKGDQ
jgi:hypothetical protein